MTEQEILIERIKQMPPELCAEVAEIIDLVMQRRSLEARKARAEAIAAYVAENAGGVNDLDSELEAAAVEHLLSTPDK